MNAFLESNKRMVFNALIEGLENDKVPRFKVIFDRFYVVASPEAPLKHTLPVARRVVENAASLDTAEEVVRAILKALDNLAKYSDMVFMTDDPEANALVLVAGEALDTLGFSEIAKSYVATTYDDINLYYEFRDQLMDFSK